MAASGAGSAAMALAISLGFAAAPVAQDRPCAKWAAEQSGGAGSAAALLLDGALDAAAVRNFFRNHRVAVAALAEVLSTEARGARVRLDYTSLNFASGGSGSDVIYPHEATLHFAEGAQLPPAGQVDFLLVLEVRDDAAHSYYWAGCALPSDGVALDWFGDRPELQFHGAKGDDGR